MPTIQSTRARYAVIALVAIGLSAVPGCNIVAPVALLVHGPERIAPAYVLPPDRPTVVLIDTATTNPIRPAVRAAIAEQVGVDLMASGAVASVIDHRSAQSIASMDRLGNQMPVSEVGRAVGAEVVIHVMVESFGLTPDGTVYTPTTSLRIKVIDASDEARLFPDEREGKPVVITRRVSATTLPERGSAWTNAELEFATYTGTAVAQMFYEHERTSSHLIGR